MSDRETTLNGLRAIRKYLAQISNSQDAHVLYRRAARMRENHINAAIRLIEEDGVR